VQYLHIGKVLGQYSVGVLVFPPRVQMSLYDHPGMVVLSQVLCIELGVTSYGVVAPQPRGNAVRGSNHNGNSWMDTYCNDAHGNKDARPPRLVLCTSFGRIREFLLNHAFLFSSNDGEFDRGGARRQAAAVNPILLRARPNLNPMGATRRRRRGQGRGGGGSGNSNRMLEFILIAPNVTCLYHREGNCHTFVAGSRGVAVLGVLFPPYNKGSSRECTHYKRRVSTEEEEVMTTTIMATGDSRWQWPLFAPMPINQPDNFNCLGRSYNYFGLD
jgi:hypothetical protein